jgi:ribosomal protein L11 methyltransferase
LEEKHLKVLQNGNWNSAFVQKDLWDETILEDIHILQSENLRLIIHSKKSASKWNEEWEKNFEAIDVDGNCNHVPFH